MTSDDGASKSASERSPSAARRSSAVWSVTLGRPRLADRDQRRRGRWRTSNV